MKIGFISYPMLWQRTGGLQVQIRQTMASLDRLGIKTKCVDVINDRLSDFDLIHVFSATHGLYLTVEEARLQGVKVVISPVFQPDLRLSDPYLYKLSDWFCRSITANRVKTSYGYIRGALKAADHIVALSEKERCVIIRGYDISNDIVTVVPNGIDDLFFSADESIYLASGANKPGFVLVVGSISSFKNQLAVVRATSLPLVFVGQIVDQSYYNQCVAEAGGRLSYLGTFEYGDPLLASIYAAAGVTVLASKGEAFGLSVVESLASGTPAIITRNNGLSILDAPPFLQFVDGHDISQLRVKIEMALSVDKSNSDAIKNIVRHLGWNAVGRKLQDIYSRLISGESVIPTEIRGG